MALVDCAGELDGVLQVRLTPGEGQMAADSLQGADPLRLGAMWGC